MEAIRWSRQPTTKTDDLLRFLIRPDPGLCRWASRRELNDTCAGR